MSIIKDFDKRRSLTKFRISPHTIKIEEGRFSKPPTSLEKRVCDYCSQEIEDEIHFLITCPKYAHIRKHFFSLVQKHCKNFILFNNNSKFNWLLSNITLVNQKALVMSATLWSQLFNTLEWAKNGGKGKQKIHVPVLVNITFI